MDFYSCVLKQDKLLTSKSNSPCYKSFYSDASTACLCTYHSAVYDKCGPMLSNDSPALNFILFLNSQGVCCLEQTKDKLFCESEIKKVDKFLEMFEKILEVSGLGNLVTKLDKFGVIPTSEENNNLDEDGYEFDESVRLPELEKRGIFFQRESNRNNRRKNKYGKPIRSNHKLKNNKNSKVSEVPKVEEEITSEIHENALVGKQGEIKINNHFNKLPTMTKIDKNKIKTLTVTSEIKVTNTLSIITHTDEECDDEDEITTETVTGTTIETTSTSENESTFSESSTSQSTRTKSKTKTRTRTKTTETISAEPTTTTTEKPSSCSDEDDETTATTTTTTGNSSSRSNDDEETTIITTPGKPSSCSDKDDETSSTEVTDTVTVISTLTYTESKPPITITTEIIEFHTTTTVVTSPTTYFVRNHTVTDFVTLTETIVEEETKTEVITESHLETSTKFRVKLSHTTDTETLTQTEVSTIYKLWVTSTTATDTHVEFSTDTVSFTDTVTETEYDTVYKKYIKTIPLTTETDEITVTATEDITVTFTEECFDDPVTTTETEYTTICKDPVTEISTETETETETKVKVRTKTKVITEPDETVTTTATVTIPSILIVTNTGTGVTTVTQTTIGTTTTTTIVISFLAQSLLQQRLSNIFERLGLAVPPGMAKRDLDYDYSKPTPAPSANFENQTFAAEMYTAYTNSSSSGWLYNSSYSNTSDLDTVAINMASFKSAVVPFFMAAIFFTGILAVL
ncbi:hypothetical protein B5S33_g870 [[Candida] boidinii]|nr:hypothetical protein B5S33_g870 [[Candida] boidinii]